MRGSRLEHAPLGHVSEPEPHGALALLADEVLPKKPLRQWVLSLPLALRLLLAAKRDELLGVTVLAAHAQKAVLESA